MSMRGVRLAQRKSSKPVLPLAVAYELHFFTPYLL